MSTESSTQRPRRWFEMVIMYPALFLAVAQYVPSIVKSFQFDVPFSEVAASIKKNDIIVQNPDCLKDQKFQSVQGNGDASIFVVVCPSKVLAVLVVPNDKNQKGEWNWISLPGSGNKQGASLIIQDAAAKEVLAPFQVAQEGATVICQKPLEDGLLRIRIKNPDGLCVDQTVNTYTGVVVSTAPIACDPSCS